MEEGRAIPRCTQKKYPPMHWRKENGAFTLCLDENQRYFENSEAGERQSEQARRSRKSIEINGRLKEWRGVEKWSTVEHARKKVRAHIIYIYSRIYPSERNIVTMLETIIYQRHVFCQFLICLVWRRRRWWRWWWGWTLGVFLLY